MRTRLNFCVLSVTIWGIWGSIGQSSMQAQQNAASPTILLVGRQAVLTPGPDSLPVMAFDNKTGKLATAHSNGMVRWWTGQSGTMTDLPWPKVTGTISALDIGPQGRRLAVAADNIVEIYERATKKLLAKVTATAAVKSVVFSHNEERLAVASDRECQLLDAATGKVLHTEAVVGPFKAVVFTDHDETLIIADKEDKHTVLTLKDFKSTRRGYFQNPTKEQKGRYLTISNLAVSGDQRVLGVILPPGRLLGLGENKITWGTRQMATLKDWGDFQALISHDGRFALCLKSGAAGVASEGQVWDLVDNRQVGKLDKLPDSIQAVAFSPAQTLVAIRSNGGEVGIWNLKSVFESPTTPSHLFGSAVALKNPSDPDAPLAHKQLLVERTKVPNAPPYLREDAWKVSPFGTGTHLNLLKVVKDTTCFFVMPHPTTPQEFDQYFAIVSFLEEKEGWLDCGPCPWQPNALLMCQTVSAGRDSTPVGSLPLRLPGTQLVFASNHAILEPENLKLLPVQTQRALFVNNIRSLFLKSQFSEIEKIASTSRNKKETFGWGDPKINAVYAGMLPVKYLLTAEKCQELAAAYQKAEPRSLTAQYLAARSQISLGWSYRGTEFAERVPQANAQRFASSLAAAEKLLNQGAARFAQDPALEQGLLRALPGTRLSADAVIDLILKGLKKDPANLETITSGVAFLLPRWTGQPRAALQLTERIRQQHPGNIGKALCAKVALDIFSFEPERWGDLYEFDARQFEQDWDAYYQLRPQDYYLATNASQIFAIYGSLPKAQTLWKELGLNASVAAAGTPQALGEWTDRLKDARHPALLWSRFGKGIGRLMLSPDGERLLTVSQVGQMNFCKTATGELVGQDVADFFMIWDGVLPREGLAIMATESSILHFDNATGVRRVAYPVGKLIGKAKFTNDGSRVFVVDDDADVHLLNPETGASLAVIRNVAELLAKAPGGIRAPGGQLAISPDQKVAAISSGHNLVRIIQTSDGKLLSTFPEGTDRPGSLCFDETGKQLWFARGEKVTTWDIAKREPVGDLPAVKRIPANLVMSRDGRYLAMVQNAYNTTSSAEVIFLDRKAANLQWKPLPELRADAQLAWHPTKPWLVTYSYSGILRVWDVTKL